MNTWNTLLESFHQRVYKITLATVKRHIHQVENPTPAMVISVEAKLVDNAILLDFLTSEVVLEEPEIESTDPKIPIDNNCTDDELHFGMPADRRDYKDERDESDTRDTIPNARCRQWAATELERFDLGTRAVDRYKGEDGDDADEKNEALQPMMNQHRLWRTEARVGPAMSRGMRVRMATMQMRSKKHHNLTMDQPTMWSTEGIVVESMKIGQCFSDL